MVRNICLILIILCVTYIKTAHAASQNVKTLPQFQYHAQSSPMTGVDDVLLKAKQKQKLALIVLGASWCHDSVGLAKKFSSESLLKVINENYETLFVDVGYLQDRRDITQRFGYANYFATPTVLIVNPHTEKLLNWDTVKRWGFADSISAEDYFSYFSQFSYGNIATHSAPENEAILAFANNQSSRLQAAYQALGPLLAADEQGESNSAFLPLWKEVRQFRMTLQEDIIKLQKQVAHADDDSELMFPTYGPFSWE